MIAMESPTVVARHSAPKLSGVEGFSFPVYCVVTNRKGKREKRVFQTWQPQRDKGGAFGCSISLKEWSSLSYLPTKIMQSVKSHGNAITVASAKQIATIGRHQRVLWSNAFKEKKPVARPYDIKRKKRIEQQAKGKKRVTVPTCAPELVGTVKVRSEAAVVLDSGGRQGVTKLMALRDGAIFEAPKHVVEHNDAVKSKQEFTKKHA